MEKEVYLDNNSTTPIDPLVVEAVLPHLTEAFGNPSNTSHDYGTRAAQAVERARSQVAQLLSCRAKEVIFTSGATESNNLAILGAARKNRARGDHVVTTPIEHKSVLIPCKQLEREGFHVTYLPVDRYGQVSPDDVPKALSERTVLASVIIANNEIGTIQRLREISEACRERGVLFHSDAAQAGGKLALDVDELGVDFLSISAHKMYGPKGVGALYVRSGCSRRIGPLLYGGGQEGGLRPGTLPVPNIVGLGIACELAYANLATEPARLNLLRERLSEKLLSVIPQMVIHGHPAGRLPGLLSIGIPGVDGDALIHTLKGLAVSQGSACAQGSFEPSHVLRAIGVGVDLARASFRFGIGRFNTEQDIDQAVERFAQAVARVAHA